MLKIFVKRKWSFFNSPFLSIFAIFEIGGYARLEAVTLFMIVTKNSFSHNSIGNWTSFKLMYILYFNNKLKILKTLFKVVLRYFFDWVYNNCLVALKDLSRCGQDTLCNIHCLWKLFNKKYFQRELTFLLWMKVNNWSFPIYFFRYIFKKLRRSVLYLGEGLSKHSTLLVYTSGYAKV